MKKSFRKNIRKICYTIIFILMLISIFSVIKINITRSIVNTTSYKGISQEEFNDVIHQQQIINISECSDEFMNTYFEEINSLNETISKADEKTQKEINSNMLIVTSKETNIDPYGANKVIKGPNNQFILVYDTEEKKESALNNLNNNKSIIDVDTNEEFELTTDDITTERNEIQSTYNSWGVEKSGLDVASNAADTKSLEKIVVAIIDTGCNLELVEESFPNKIEGTYDVLESTGAFNDLVGHGTHIAGTIAESTPSNVKVFPVKVSNSKSISTVNIISAINYIVYNDIADVINMSFGSYSKKESMYTAIVAANEKNIICVAAAGNDNSSANFYPASFDNTMSIAACTETLEKASFSNYNSEVDFIAPGQSILSVNGTKSGTSMAAPHAASAVAISKSYNKNYTLDNTVEFLKKYCTDLGDEGKDKYFGYGFINLKEVVYCSCNCKSCDEIYCLGCECDLCYGCDNIYKDTVQKIEVVSPVLRLDYNYGSITNLSKVMINVYYEDRTEQIGLLELEDCEITGYDPYCYNSQTVVVKYKEQTASFELNVGAEYESGWTYESNGEETIKLTGFKDTSDGINILYVPEYIDNYKVTELADKLFYLKGNNFKKVTLPETVNKIGAKVFLEKDKLEDVYVLSQEIYIGDYAFYGCNVLETSFKGIKQLGNSAFYDCRKLKQVEFANGIDSIGNSSFFYCVSLESIVLPDTIATIGNYAFSSCINLLRINIPSNITEIGSYAFSYTAITSVEIPEGITVIKSGTFSECNNLEYVIFPETLVTIETRAFYECSNLKEIEIPRGVTSIYEDSFSKCNNLEIITVDSENTTYDSRENCGAVIETATNKLVVGSNYTIIPKSIVTIGKNAFDNRINLSYLEIPEGVITIEEKAFYNCVYLQKIILPKSLESIASDSFEDCSNLTMYVYKDSYSKDYAVNNSINYRYIDREIISLSVYNLSKTTYKAFEKVDMTGVIIRIIFDDNTFVDITEGYSIIYETENESFRYGDTKFTISYDQNDIRFTKDIEVTVNKVIPEYIVPSGLTAKVGQKLSDIILPNGFEWMDSTLSVGEVGTKTFKVKYVPTDTVNYETIENISVELNVIAVEEQDKITINNLTNNNYLLSGFKVKSVDVNNNVISSYKVKDITKDISLSSNLSYEVYDISNKKLSESSDISTGCMINILKKQSSGTKEVFRKYYAVIYGDTNCDGLINSGDLLTIKKHLLKTKLISNDVVKEAADTNLDKTINSGDLLSLKKHLLGKTIISKNKY